MSAKRYYWVTCVRSVCKQSWRWDILNPTTCPKCGSDTAVYRRHNVCVRDLQKENVDMTPARL
jgi:hypothetical protein